MKDYQEIDDAIELKKIWPAILEHGSLQIQDAVEPHEKISGESVRRLLAGDEVSTGVSQ